MFPTLDSARAIAKQYAGIKPNNLSWDEALDSLLETSKAPTTYRPWVVAAFHIWSYSATARSQLVSGAGATFLKPSEIMPAIQGLLATQEAMDGDSTEIPESWTAQRIRYICGCPKENGSATIDNYVPYGSSVV